MPERIPNLAEFDDISPIVGKMLLAAAFMIDRAGEGGRGIGQRNSFRSVAPDYGEYEKPLEFLYF